MVGVPSCFWLADYEQKPAIWTENETMNKTPCKRKKIKIKRDLKKEKGEGREGMHTVYINHKI